MDLVAALRRLVADPDRVAAGQAVREQHGQDLSYHPQHLPDVVVYPVDTREVSRILAFANEHRVPVVPFGAGSSLEGHVIPVQGGICLDMTQMNRILEIRAEDLLVRVEPGVTRTQLNRQLGREGLYFPIDPGADATLGGMVATNASGTTAVRYGAMRQQVLGLEVVLADGRVITTGSLAVKSSAGYNLTGLFVGSEGTLGVITGITLRVHPLPEEVVAARAVFPSLDAAARVAVGLIRVGAPVERVELVDALTIEAVNAYKGTDYPAAPTLFLEFSGSAGAVRDGVETARELADLEGCTDFRTETDPQARQRLWEARHHAALAITARFPGKKLMVTDVCVPISHLPEAIAHARATVEAEGLTAAILGHVGDGNYHAIFTVDPQDPTEMERAERVNAAIVDFALARGGTCTGEHGVGLGKRRYLLREHGEAVALMRLLKQTLDPHNILNPGKILPGG